MPDQPVRVVCPDCRGSRVEKNAVWGDDMPCSRCWHGTKSSGTILATLADPEIAARLALADAYMAWYHDMGTPSPGVALCVARDRVDALVPAPVREEVEGE